MPNSLSWTLGKTGGLSYHLLAMRYRRTLWQPFISHVESWLEEWKPNSRNLIVFGPSGGWTLPKDFISRFDRVIAIEPDPIARQILTSRFAQASKIDAISRHDLLPWSSRNLEDIEPLKDFLSEHSDAAILFSNVLGQMPLTLPPRARHAHQLCSKKLMTALEGRVWASYHDIVSSDGGSLRLKKDHASRIENIQAFAEENLTIEGELIDHESLWLSESRETKLATWQIRPKRTHVIGFVQSKR